MRTLILPAHPDRPGSHITEDRNVALLSGFTEPGQQAHGTPSAAAPLHAAWLPRYRDPREPFPTRTCSLPNRPRFHSTSSRSR
jgi:hypothetical protein